MSNTDPTKKTRSQPGKATQTRLQKLYGRYHYLLTGMKYPYIKSQHGSFTFNADLFISSITAKTFTGEHYNGHKF
jgi:hypothetical protein